MIVEIRDLGPPEVRLDGGEPPRELLWRKNLALLVYLARSPDLRRTREHLTGLLWGGTGESAARHSLNEALRTVRRQTREDLIVSEGDQVALDPEGVRLDTGRLEAALAGERWYEAAGLVRGRFMEGFGVPDANAFEDWLAAERVHWTRRSVDALAARAEACIRAGELAAAREAAGRALGLDPMSGAGIRAVIKVTALAGERASALRLFQEYADRLREQLGVDPDSETRRLADRIQRERTWKLPESLAPEVRDRGTMPLIGRAAELLALVEAWQRGATAGRAALLVVQGEPGSGRSRMLEELAGRARLEGAIVIGSRAVPADRDAPWSGLVGLCRDELATAPGVPVAAAEALAGVAALLPAWGERFAEEIAGADPAPPGQALTEIVRVVAEEQPVLLCLDDAAWCDTVSLEALQALLRDLEERPVSLALAVTARPGPPELDRLRAEVGRELEGCAVELQPLSAAELREMAARELPGYDEAALDRLARRLAADSAGLPLLAVELLHGVRLGLELGDEVGAWPSSRRTLDQTRPGELPDPVVGAIRTGFWALGPAAREAVLAAAALGGRIGEEDLLWATGLEPEALEQGLDELEWARWLASDERGYTFVARIVREVLLADMLTPGRVRRLRTAAAAAGEGEMAEEGGEAAE